jgi:hypothetical protein
MDSSIDSSTSGRKGSLRRSMTDTSSISSSTHCPRSHSQSVTPSRTTPSRRSSKRTRRSSFDSLETAGDNNSYRRQLVPYESVRYCIEWGLPKPLCCSGCTLFGVKVNKDIDNRQDDSQFASALVTQQKLTGKKYQCKQLLEEVCGGHHQQPREEAKTGAT